MATKNGLDAAGDAREIGFELQKQVEQQYRSALEEFVEWLREGGHTTHGRFSGFKVIVDDIFSGRIPKLLDSQHRGNPPLGSIQGLGGTLKTLIDTMCREMSFTEDEARSLVARKKAESTFAGDDDSFE